MDLSRLPKVDSIISAIENDNAALGAELSRKLLAEAARAAVGSWRQRLLGGEQPPDELFALVLADTVAAYRRALLPAMRRVINATGVVLHTNLGRAPLAAEAAQAIGDIAGGYCNLEIDMASGQRSSRYDHVTRALCSLSGAEDALVVNNNAAAVLLVLDELARGREAIVSRGQLVEIGGSFRIPDVMAKSGARLVEVGTTNKTYIRDYQAAITAETGLLLLVHTSNFRVQGFTAEVTPAELVRLGREYHLPVADDLGSGCLYDLAGRGVGEEPLLQTLLKAGVDIVTCSGDKLFGGPQAGIILGRAEYIARLKKNPLTRALRIDKFTLAALQATLAIYERGDEARDIPVLRMIGEGRAQIAPRAERLAALLADAQAERYCEWQLRDGVSEVGGGSLPTVELPTRLLALRPKRLRLMELAARLRSGSVAVLPYIHDGWLIFDPRTMSDEDIRLTAELLLQIFGEDEDGR
ncbi:MAG: L-seryl-tRNA(Sec) selenium transferase [Bacillota bacterium]|nr:L-seryl-tRNA(Sec) selenium transferase [Bacillota bacterium]